MIKVASVLLGLHALAVSTSIAAMEFATWSMVVLALVGFLFEVKSQGFSEALQRIKLGPDIILWLFAFVMALGVLIMPQTDLSRLQILGFFRWIFILYVLVFLLQKTPASALRRILMIFTLGILLASVYGALQFFTGLEFFRPHREIVHPYGSFWRSTGFFSLPLTYAYSLGMGGLLLGGLFLSAWRSGEKLGRVQWMWLLAFIGSAAGVAVSLTRGAWVGFVVSLLFLFIYIPRKWKWVTAVLAGLVLTVALGTSSALRERLASAVDPQNHSNQLRWAIWESNLEIFKDHPWVGVGLTRNSEYLPEYYEKLGYENIDFIGHAHSNYLQMLSGGGIFGFLTYMALIFYFMFFSYQLWRESPSGSLVKGLALGGLAAQVFLHVGGLTECNFTDGEVNHMLVLVWAILISQSSQRKKVLS